MKLLTSIVALMIILAFSTMVFAEKAGVIKFYKGSVLIKTSNTSKQWINAKLNMSLDEKSIIKTSKNSEAQIKLKDGSLFRITSDQTVNMQDIMTKAAGTESGNSSAMARLLSLKNKLGKGDNSGVESPTAVAGVRGADVSKKSESPVRPSELIWEE